jgi:hypothetical protein
MIEEWRSVVGFEGSYEVSNLGRVRSLDRVVTFQKYHARGRRVVDVTARLKGKLLRSASNLSGHRFVVLTGQRIHSVHTLVLNAFTGPSPDGMECCHNDGDPSNNVHSNLRWDTRSNNIKDDFRSGVRKRGNISRGTIPGNSYARRTA